LSLPCICYKCARCLTQESLKDPGCLAVEQENCVGRDCSNCNFTCERYTDQTDFKRSTRKLLLMEG